MWVCLFDVRDAGVPAGCTRFGLDSIPDFPASLSPLDVPRLAPHHEHAFQRLHAGHPAHSEQLKDERKRRDTRTSGLERYVATLN
jgi:hypothetical protein